MEPQISGNFNRVADTFNEYHGDVVFNTLPTGVYKPCPECEFRSIPVEKSLCRTCSALQKKRLDAQQAMYTKQLLDNHKYIIRQTCVLILVFAGLFTFFCWLYNPSIIAWIGVFPEVMNKILCAVELIFGIFSCIFIFKQRNKVYDHFVLWH